MFPCVRSKTPPIFSAIPADAEDHYQTKRPIMITVLVACFPCAYCSSYDVESCPFSKSTNCKRCSEKAFLWNVSSHVSLDPWPDRLHSYSVDMEML